MSMSASLYDWMMSEPGKGIEITGGDLSPEQVKRIVRSLSDRIGEALIRKAQADGLTLEELMARAKNGPLDWLDLGEVLSEDDLRGDA